MHIPSFSNRYCSANIEFAQVSSKLLDLNAFHWLIRRVTWGHLLSTYTWGKQIPVIILLGTMILATIVMGTCTLSLNWVAIGCFILSSIFLAFKFPINRQVTWWELGKDQPPWAPLFSLIKLKDSSSFVANSWSLRL